MSVAILFAVLAAPLTCLAQQPAPRGSTTNIPGELGGIHLTSPLAADGQWTMPAGDYSNTRYTPLDKINTGNVFCLPSAELLVLPRGRQGFH